MPERITLPAPLFEDPIYDGPTDPVVIYNRQERKWVLFYTQRRATAPGQGVAWVHGTAIGVAESADGARWLYRGTLEGLDIEPGHNTFWAPEVIWAEGCYHMYVSYITGIPTDWEWPRRILHYTSNDLWDWRYVGEIDLDSGRVIDVCVYETAPHLYKMWYKDETRGSRIYAAVSTDLYSWQVVGREADDIAQEGPNVFELGGYKWMITDYWNGLAVYRSEDFGRWERCPDILRESGTRPGDQGEAHHADVEVKDGRAIIIYFCHPGAADVKGEKSEVQLHRSVVQAAELKVQDGILVCDRNGQAAW